MDFVRLLGAALAVCCFSVSASKLLSGQGICRPGTGHPCYKIAYFQESWRKVNFEQANQACRSDGGELLSIESDKEQKRIQGFIQELQATDGDFWIGLRRDQSSQEAGPDCPEQYHWLDGSKATFRNWHWDEPSCGYEVCVVMYHQPSAPPGPDGFYMFQWNDDNCDTKNNFICKYSREKQSVPTARGNSTNTEVPAVSPKPKYTSVTEGDDEIKIRLSTASDGALNVAYILLPTIPLLLLLLVALGIFCFKLLSRKKSEQTAAASPKEMGFWVDRCDSPSPDVYNVIRKQHDADLAGTRPDIKNTSFLGSSPDTPPGDYDNLAGRDTESGFVTLASTESGFVTNDIYETCQGRGRYYREAGWVENEIYGY